MIVPPHPICEMLRQKGMAQLRHKQSGETALCRAAGLSNQVILVQFDHRSHPKSHGWHSYDPDFFEEIPE